VGAGEVVGHGDISPNDDGWLLLKWLFQGNSSCDKNTMRISLYPSKLFEPKIRGGIIRTTSL